MIYEFQATQDLHGWGKPWAPGAGDNLIDFIEWLDTIHAVYTVQNGTIMMDTTGQGAALVNQPLVFAEEDTTVALNADVFTESSGNANRIELLNTSNQFTARFYAGATPVAVTGSGIKIRFNWSSPGKIELKNFMLNAGSTALPYSPYSNVCMPEGFNIWDPDNDEFIQVYAGYVNSNTRELYLRPVYQEYAGEELVGPWMSSLDLYAEDTTPTEGAFVIDFGGELTSFEITAFMLQTLLDSLGIRQHFTDGAGLLNSLMDQAQGRVRSEEELLHLSRPLKVIPIGDQLPPGLKIRPISKDVLPGLPGKFIR